MCHSDSDLPQALQKEAFCNVYFRSIFKEENMAVTASSPCRAHAFIFTQRERGVRARLVSVTSWRGRPGSVGPAARAPSLQQLLGSGRRPPPSLQACGAHPGRQAPGVACLCAHQQEPRPQSSRARDFHSDAVAHDPSKKLHLGIRSGGKRREEWRGDDRSQQCSLGRL